MANEVYGFKDNKQRVQVFDEKKLIVYKIKSLVSMIKNNPVTFSGTDPGVNLGNIPDNAVILGCTGKFSDTHVPMRVVKWWKDSGGIPSITIVNDYAEDTVYDLYVCVACPFRVRGE